MPHSQHDTRVLVVDDEQAIVELVSEYLRARGFDVVTAGDGDAALQAVRRDQPDVVLADLRLPNRGGMSLLEAIREQPRPVAVVVMTGFGTVETATQAMKLGASDYLLKPVRLRDVHAALVHALDDMRRQQGSALRRAQCLLYEKLLAIGGPCQPEELTDALARVLLQRAAARGVVVLLDEEGQWRRVAAAGDDALDGDATESIEVDAGGVRLRVELSGCRQWADAQGWSRDVARATATALGTAAPTG